MPMGFENFKIEGRTANLFQLLDTYCFYLMKPKHREEARLMLLNNLEKHKVVAVQKPKKGIWQEDGQ